jgi:hypothetical protein
MKDNNLELGKYLESDLLEITEDEVDGGYTCSCFNFYMDLRPNLPKYCVHKSLLKER